MEGNKLAPSGSTDGNTKLTRRWSSALYWCFTLNNFTEEEFDNLHKICKEKGKFIIGKEVGSSGTPHLQGFISCHKKERMPEVAKNKRIHWELAKAGEEANKKYCGKDGNYVTNFITKETKRKALKIPTKEELYDWQKETLEDIEKSNDREIIWRYCIKGNTGKTTLAKYLIFETGALLIDGRKTDILHAATEWVKSMTEEEIYEKKLIIIADFSRSLEDYISYDSLEKIKNGVWFSGKYESKSIMIPPPTVIVFANFRPNELKLSQDRWNIKRIDYDEEEVEVRDAETESEDEF